MSILILALLFWLGAWALNGWLARSALGNRRDVRLFIPALFGVTLLVLWEGIVRGLNVPPVILPAPTAIWATLTSSLPMLWEDFAQTILKGALSGYVIG